MKNIYEISLNGQILLKLIAGDWFVMPDGHYFYKPGSKQELKAYYPLTHSVIKLEN